MEGRPEDIDAPAERRDPYLPLPESDRHGVALCLSGGGFRAALFHIGAVRRLDELGILGKVWTVSSTGGGSIAAAHLVTRLAWPVTAPLEDWDERVAEPLRALAREDFRSGRSSGPLPGWRRRRDSVESLALDFERRLAPFSILELPTMPRFIFAGADPAAPSVAYAVAATAEGAGSDHLAVEPVWRDHELLLVSDGGGFLDPASVVEQDARVLGQRWLVSSFETGLLDGAYWGLESSRDRYDPSDRNGYSRNFIRGVFSRFESGLGGLSDGQARMLENHGYLVADSAIAARVPALVSDVDRPIRVPHPDWMDQTRD